MILHLVSSEYLTNRMICVSVYLMCNQEIIELLQYDRMTQFHHAEKIP